MTTPTLPARLSWRQPIAGTLSPSRPYYDWVVSTQHWTVQTAILNAGVEAQLNDLGYRVEGASSEIQQVRAEVATLRGDPRLEAGERAERLGVMALFQAMSKQDARFRQEIGEIHSLLVALSQQIAETNQRQAATVQEAARQGAQVELQGLVSQAGAAASASSKTDDLAQVVTVVVDQVETVVDQVAALHGGAGINFDALTGEISLDPDLVGDSIHIGGGLASRRVTVRSSDSYTSMLLSGTNGGQIVLGRESTGDQFSLYTDTDGHLHFYDFAAGADRLVLQGDGTLVVPTGLLRLNVAPTAAAVTQTHHVPININGTPYKLLLAS